MVTRMKHSTEFHRGKDSSYLGRDGKARIGMASGKEDGAKRAYLP